MRPLIFEQDVNLTAQIEDRIRFAVSKWMPFVVIDRIDVNNFETDTTLKRNQIDIRLQFTVGQTQGVLNQRIAA